MHWPLKLLVTYTPDEASELENAVLLDSHGGSKLTVIGCAAVPTLLGVVGLIVRVGVQHAHWVLLGLGATVGIVVWLQQKIRNSRLVPVEFVISETDITFGSEGNVSALAGDSFVKLLETKNLFVLRSDKYLVGLPYRLFDSEQLEMFRSLAESWVEAEVDEVPKALATDDLDDSGGVTVSYRLGLRDYFAKATVSWFPRTLFIFFAVLQLGVFVAAAVGPPPPDAVLTNTEVFLYFTLPSAVLGPVIVVVMLTLFSWFTHRADLVETTLKFCDRGIRTSVPPDESFSEWQASILFKESSNAFYIWWPGKQAWHMIPFRAFDSDSDRIECRRLLHANLTESTWFWG